MSPCVSPLPQEQRSTESTGPKVHRVHRSKGPHSPQVHRVHNSTGPQSLSLKAEQKFLGALITFHNRRIDRNQAQLRKAKSCNKNTSVKAGKSQSDSCNIPESLQAITANLEKRLEEVNAMLYDLKEANNKTVEI